MALGVLGMYGIIPFVCSSSAVATFKDVNIEHATRFATHEVIGQTPVNEYIGPDRNKVSFSIQLRAAFGSSPAVYVALLNAQLETGEANHLILGPDYMGKYILTGFTEERKYFNGIGLSIATDVSLTLEEDKGFSLISAVKNAVGGLL